MAIRLRKKRVHGGDYWYAVESVRVNGKPTARHVAYLGRAEDIVAGRELRAPRTIRSRSHGAVAALNHLCERLKIAETIDAHVPERRASIASVGTTLTLVAIGRACHPTSKRGFAQWAGTTTLAQLFGVEIGKLTSAFFWDQMDKVSLQALDEIEAQILARAAREFDVKTDLLVYDTTSFFTYIASDNCHCDLPQRGKSKQRRNDLRQLALALLVSRDGGVPLGSHMYRGNLNDVSVFIEAFSRLRERLTAMAVEIESVTFVYDKGNVSKENQAKLEAIDTVTSLVPSHHKDLLALNEADAERLEDGTAVWRVRKEVWGKPRTLVVVVSEPLRHGQRLGLDQHLGKAVLALERLRHKLLSATRRRKRDAVQRTVTEVCQAPQLKGVLRVEIVEPRAGYFDVRHHVDMARYTELCEHSFGRRVLMATREQWSTQEIVAAYRGQSHVEGAFRVLKDPFHLAVRPQYHWTDQKIRVHVFCCVIAYLLSSLMTRQLRRAGLKHSPRQMLDLLEQVRLATWVEARGEGRPGRPAAITQLEDCGKEAMEVFRLFVPEGQTR